MAPLGMSDVPMRSAFLVRDAETVAAAWLLGGDLPDLDAIVQKARELSA